MSLGGYLQELSASIGFSTLEQPPLGEDYVLDLVKSVGVFCLVKYTDGFAIYGKENYSKRNFEAVKCLKVAVLGGKIVAVFSLVSAPMTVSFIDTVEGSSIFHVIHHTAEVVLITANAECVAIVLVTGRVHFYDSANLEEMFSVQTSPPSFALGDRWAVYRTNSEPPQTAASFVSALSAMGQDAFDNMVLMSAGTVAGSPPVSPPNRFSKLVVCDVVSQEVVAEIENPAANNRTVECLAWSGCGTRLLVSAGNGHTVQVFGIMSGKAALSFELLFELNRGVTPAVVKSLGALGDHTVVLTAKGTVHVFARTECVGKLRDVTGVVLTSNSEFVVATKTHEIQRFSHVDYVTPISIMRLHDGPMIVDEMTTSLCLEVNEQTCQLPSVPLWMSPLIKFGPSFAVPVRLPDGTLVDAYKRACHFTGNPKSIQSALDAPINAGGGNKAEYVFSNREGFVQVASIG